MSTSSLSRFGLPALLLCACWIAVPADDIDPRLAEAEARRIAVIKQIEPSVVAVFSRGGQGGGSGVLIDADGYALTNFHVVAGSGPLMQCGLPDGILYDAVLVGLDKVGDIALIKLLPRKEGQPFPYAKLGDSDRVRAGDWTLALGNPFLLATDYTPTVTFGMVSGVNRYQYPANGLLEYTDCIQVDASINPGNSGGPLFNMDGELIGINGRISLEKRGRVNVGVGYAISINQIKNFMGHLRAGMETDHASLGALVSSDEEEGGLGRISVNSVLDISDVARRGLEVGDELLKFAGRDITTVNQFKNVIGIYPRGWRLPLKFRHTDDKKQTREREVLVRLMGVQRRELREPEKEDQPKPGQPPVKPPTPATDSPAAKFYNPQPGFANYYFNRQARDRLLAEFAKAGDFQKLGGKWVLSGDIQFEDQRPVTVEITLEEGDGKPAVTYVQGGAISFDLKPLDSDSLDKLSLPPDSGGLLMALYQYRQLLTLPSADKTFLEFHHGGQEPFYVPEPDSAKPNYEKERIDTEVLRTKLGAYPAKWFFAKHDETRGNVTLTAGALAGFEVTLDAEQDPCEIALADYRPVDGRQFPHRIDVRFKDKRFGTLTLKKVELK